MKNFKTNRKLGNYCLLKFVLFSSFILSSLLCNEIINKESTEALIMRDKSDISNNTRVNNLKLQGNELSTIISNLLTECDVDQNNKVVRIQLDKLNSSTELMIKCSESTFMRLSYAKHKLTTMKDLISRYFKLSIHRKNDESMIMSIYNTVNNKEEEICNFQLESAFLTNSEKQSPHINTNKNSYMNVKVQEASVGGFFITIIVLAALGFGGIGIYKYLMKKKQRILTEEQIRNDKLKFIPRIGVQSESVFNESINGLKNIFPSKKALSNRMNMVEEPKIISPAYKATQALKLEDNHPSSVINDNIFTNIEHSPHSSGENSPAGSNKETPKSINFNIEFSILENDKKKKNVIKEED